MQSHYYTITSLCVLLLFSGACTSKETKEESKETKKEPVVIPGVIPGKADGKEFTEAVMQALAKKNMAGSRYLFEIPPSGLDPAELRSALTNCLATHLALGGYWKELVEEPLIKHGGSDYYSQIESKNGHKIFQNLLASALEIRLKEEMAKSSTTAIKKMTSDDKMQSPCLAWLKPTKDDFQTIFFGFLQNLDIVPDKQKEMKTDAWLRTILYNKHSTSKPSAFQFLFYWEDPWFVDAQGGKGNCEANLLSLLEHSQSKSGTKFTSKIVSSNLEKFAWIIPEDVKQKIVTCTLNWNALTDCLNGQISRDGIQREKEISRDGVQRIEFYFAHSSLRGNTQIERVQKRILDVTSAEMMTRREFTFHMSFKNTEQPEDVVKRLNRVVLLKNAKPEISEDDSVITVPYDSGVLKVKNGETREDKEKDEEGLWGKHVVKYAQIVELENFQGNFQEFLNTLKTLKEDELEPGNIIQDCQIPIIAGVAACNINIKEDKQSQTKLLMAIPKEMDNSFDIYFLGIPKAEVQEVFKGVSVEGYDNCIKEIPQIFSKFAEKIKSPNVKKNHKLKIAFMKFLLAEPEARYEKFKEYCKGNLLLKSENYDVEFLELEDALMGTIDDSNIKNFQQIVDTLKKQTDILFVSANILTFDISVTDILKLIEKALQNPNKLETPNKLKAFTDELTQAVEQYRKDPKGLKTKVDSMIQGIVKVSKEDLDQALKEQYKVSPYKSSTQLCITYSGGHLNLEVEQSLDTIGGSETFFLLEKKKNQQETDETNYCNLSVHQWFANEEVNKWWQDVTIEIPWKKTTLAK
ncbi:MAG: hypothetical protein LiPW30_695 [Parcubacteria group bacterium LiPW_30]|nr:MAG: hypothetical protein LiPW30_695 [Parcubacteria group bacterium LiPW_30]